MKITTEQDLRHFDFWGPAKEHALELSYEQLDDLEYMLEDLYPEGIDETQLNDIMAYDFDWVKEVLGIDEEEEDEEEEEEEENEED